MSFALVNSLKVGVISDMHTNTLYDPNIDPTDHCWSTGTAQASDRSSWARVGCDPSIDLVDAMLNRYVEKFGTPDVLLVTGDLICHNVSPDRGQGSAGSYQAVKDNIAATNEIVK